MVIGYVHDGSRVGDPTGRVDHKNERYKLLVHEYMYKLLILTSFFHLCNIFLFPGRFDRLCSSLSRGSI